MRDVVNDLSTTLIGISALSGVLLLGMGFGVMATSSSGFDEEEFDRLATAGNISSVGQSERSASDYAEYYDSQTTAP